MRSHRQNMGKDTHRYFFPTLGVAGGGGATLALSAATTGAGQTVTLQRITPTGGTATVSWGDGSTSTIANGNTGTTTHVYASAGTYAISISNPSILTYIDLRDTKLSFNSVALVGCIALASLRVDISGTFNSADIVMCPLTFMHIYFPVAGTYTFNSSHIAAMSLTYLYVYFPVAGTYTFNSSHIAAMSLTSLTLYTTTAGTYTFNSSHVSAMLLTYLYIYMTVAGTYTFNSTHIAARTTITNVTVVLHATNTFTVARADWDGFPACGTIRVEAALSQAQVDNLLLGLWDGFATKTVNAGTVDLLGQSNAAPSGILQAQCPPTTGYEAAYELTTDSCGVSSKHWTSVTTA